MSEISKLLILIGGATVVGLAWLFLNIKAGTTFLKFISLFSMLLCFGMALAGVIDLGWQVLHG